MAVDGRSNHHEHTNGSSDQRDAEQRHRDPPLRRSAFRALVQDFGPFWFTWSMNSGILSILMHQCPYQFPGLLVIATIFYIFDLVLFIFFSIMFILRFAIFRRAAYDEITGDQIELTFCACWPIAFMTLTTLTSLVCSQAYWGRHAFTLVGYVMWWIECAWSLLLIFWVFTTLIRKHEASDKRIPMSIILPPVSASTVAVTGGLIVTLSWDVSARLAIPVIIVSFMMVGIGTLMGLILSTYLFHGLLSQGWVPPAQSASIFIFIGPMGQSAAALQALGQAANSKFGGYNKGTFLRAEVASSLEAACVLVALMLYGLGLVWLVLSVFIMVKRAIQRQLTWTPNWNAIIFPTATLATSTSLFANELDSPAFRTLTAGLIITLTIVFLVNLAMTVYKIAKGELLVVREDPRVRRKMEDEQKER